MWTKLLERGDSVDVIYTDFRKAFDAVPHQRLLVKLKAYGLGKQIMNWLEAFLSDRKQCVSINGVTSDWVDVSSGIPQGSVMGPLCFLLFINDLTEVVKNSCIRLFADDAKVFGPVTTLQERIGLQTDLDSILEWTKLWQLPLNIEKCSVLHLGPRNSKQQYTLGKVPLKDTDMERDLGVLIDHELKFHLHAAGVVKKCKSLLADIRRSFTCLNRMMITKLYKAMIKPVIEYGNSVWGPFYKGDKVKIEKLQRRVSKLVPELRQLPYSERLNQLKLPTLAYRRTRGDLIMIYKLLTGKTKADEGFVRTETRRHLTRGHTLRLKKFMAQKQVRRNHLLVRAVNNWNSLSETVVKSETTSTFKNRLDKVMESKWYSTD